MTGSVATDHLRAPSPSKRQARLDRTRELLSRLDEPGVDRTTIEDEIIRTNLVVAREIAGRYVARGIDADDLEQVACLGLVKAVRHYDPDRATDFLSFAVPTIRGEVRRWFRDAGWAVRPPRSIQELQAAITAAEEELTQALGRGPRPSEIASHVGTDTTTVRKAMLARGCFALASLEASSSGDPEGPTVGDQLALHEPGYATVEARAALRPVLGDLAPRQQLILEMRFGRGATQREIAETLGITQAQVSRLLKAIYSQLRGRLTSNAGTDRPQAA